MQQFDNPNKPVVSSFIRKCYYLWLLTFAVGFRQLYVTRDLPIHPAEALIWAIFILLIIIYRSAIKTSIHAALIVIFGGIGLMISKNNGISIDMAFSEFKLFLVLIPIFYVTHKTLHDMDQWRRFLIVIALTICYISILGILEYLDPEIIAPFVGSYFSEQHILFSQQGFERASFSFWGSPTVSFYLSLMLLPLFSGWLTEKKPTLKFFFLASVILCGIGIYISGGRGPWTATGFGLAAFLLFSQKRTKLLFFMIPIIYFTLLWLPQVFFDSLYSAFDFQTYYDTSAIIRRQRAQDAIDLIMMKPFFGNGWCGSGWVHSDFLQIAANLGVPALALFIGWYLNRMWQVYRYKVKTISRENAELANGILAGMCVGFFHLQTQATIVLAQLIIPLWFLLAVADTLPKLINDEV